MQGRRDSEHRIPVNGISHWYRVAGAEHGTVPVVVVHGGPGGNVYNFERTAGAALEAFTTVIYYEQRGCGRSDPPADQADYSLPALVADLEALCEHLELERVIPLGFSFGGELALEYTLAHPRRVHQLIVQAPSFAEPALAAEVQLRGFQAVATGEVRRRIESILAEGWSPRDALGKVWAAVDREAVDRFLFCDQEVARLNRRMWAESGLANTGQMARALAAQPRAAGFLDRLAAIDAPTLVLVGRHDRNVGEAACREVVRRIPRAELAVFEHSAHFPDMEETQAYVDRIRRFIGAVRR